MTKTTPLNAITEPIDKSSPLVSTTRVMPQARIPSIDTCKRMFSRFS
jgi:hypothetical protein